MTRLLRPAFSVFLLLAGLYFLAVFIKDPSQHGSFWNGILSVFWIGLGLFLLWNDFLRTQKTPPT